MIDLNIFPAEIKRKPAGNFKFLGAPIGDQEFTKSFTRRERVDNAKAILEKVPLLEDAQSSHKILMHCLGTCKVMYAMRTTRPDWISQELADSDIAVRQAFEGSTGLALSNNQWAQATLALKRGGMGLRSATAHASAAYLASRASTWKLCRSIDPSFEWDSGPDSGLTHAREAYNAVVQSADHFPHGPPQDDPGGLQRSMSAKVEEASATSLLHQATTAARARLRAVTAPHAGAWLQAVPSKPLGHKLSHTEFAAATQLWLGTQVLAEDTWCPKCDQVLDAGCSHVLACMAGGDAVACHNELRDYVYMQAQAAGLNPHREESGLLPDDPQRRPGDLSFPLWPGGTPIAMDFAVTSPLRLDAIAAAAEHTLASASAYEQVKRDDRETAQRCEAQGLRLVPMIAESFGGWGPDAQKAFNTIARAKASRTGQSVGEVTAHLYEGLSIKIIRAGARALLARIADSAQTSTQTSGALRRSAQAALVHTAP